MGLTLAELDVEAAEVLPARDTMLVVSLSNIQSRINANAAFISVINRAGGNEVTGAAGATISVTQVAAQGVAVL